MLGFANEREFCLGGSGDIRGSRKAASGHCSRGGRICSAEEGRAKFPRPVPVPFRKNAILQRASDAADLSLLRLRQGRRRLQLRDGDGEVRISGRRARGGGKNRDRRAARQGAVAAGTQAEPGTLRFGGNAPRGADFFRPATGNDGGG